MIQVLKQCPDPKRPPSRKDWEIQILSAADHFLVSTPIREVRLPGQRQRWQSVQFWSLGDAVAYVRQLRRLMGPKTPTLVYAVEKQAMTDGEVLRSCCLSEEDWYRG